MRQSLPEQQLSRCKTKGKFFADSHKTANCSMLLTIYPKELKTVSRLFGCVRDGDGYACPFCDDCRGFADGGNRRSGRTGQGAGASGSPARQSSRSSGDDGVRRPGARARTGGSSRFDTGETAPRGASDDLPLRRADRRAAGAVADLDPSLCWGDERGYLTCAICCFARITGISPSPTAANADQ